MTEQGSITAFVAVLAVALLAIAGLAVDGGRALAAREQAGAVAEQAARSGAQAVSAAGLRAGALQIDTAAATAAAERSLASAGLTGTVSVTPGQVTVSVTEVIPTTMLGIVGIATLTVHQTAVATDVHGVSKGE